MMNIQKPTLILNKEKCLRNISRMSEKAKKHKLIFRPHFKTHQSAEVGNWFKDFGVKSIAVSSFDMAVCFANNGWNDIAIAFTINYLEINKINTLAEKININILVESEEAVIFLDKNIKSNTEICIKIDTGYHRTGIDAGDFDEIGTVLKAIKRSRKLNFRGFLVHSGNTYDATSKYEIADIHYNSINKLKKLKSRYITEHPDLLLSIGDTPSCSIMDDFEGIDEIRPGNFVFYDVMQAELGSCSYDDIAVVVVCPVVAKHKTRKEIVIYGGAVHLSKDFIIKDGEAIYGLVSLFDGETWNQPLRNTYIKKLSQEHGIIKTTPDHFQKIKVGDLLAVLTIHSCLAVDVMNKKYRIE